MILRNTLTATDNASFLLCDDDYMDTIEFKEAEDLCKEYHIWTPQCSLYSW